MYVCVCGLFESRREEVFLGPEFPILYNNNNIVIIIYRLIHVRFGWFQVYCSHAANKIRKAQKQPTSVADNCTGVGDQCGNWQSHGAWPEQHAGPDAGSLSFLQLEFHHLLVPLLVLHTMHHHGVPLLEHIQGKLTAGPIETYLRPVICRFW